MIVLLDIGNTRVKAGLLGPGGLRPAGQAAWRASGLATTLDALDLPAAGRAVAAVVAGAGVADTLEAWCRDRGMTLARVRATAAAGGVRCAYPEPGRLGADRWAALVGARTLTGEACLVVDAGSAVTVDALAADGRHLGGFIVPGLALMARSLHQDTGDLAAFSAASATGEPEDFPTDTRPAIEEGAVLAVVGLVREAAARMPGTGAPKILLTGGDAARLVTHLEGAREVPDLVLQGLAGLAGA